MAHSEEGRPRHASPASVTGDGGGRALLVMSGAGVFTVPLPAAGEITLGRGVECRVRLEDPKASRMHAILHVGAALQLIDLESTNGTRVGHRAVTPNEPVEIDVGDMIQIGSTVIVVQRAEGPEPLRLWSQEAFDRRIDEECAAAERGGPPFAVLRIALDTSPLASAHQSTSSSRELARQASRKERFDAAMRELLRPGDALASGVPGRFLVLVRDAPAAAAEALSAQMALRLREEGFAIEVGLALYPRDGLRAAELQARAEKALHAPPETQRPPALPLGGGALDRLGPLILRVAASDIPVLILGETGVGKEVMARTLHERSPRASQPLVCINCAALSETLLEGELFGYEKGAFTGAVQSKEGLLESASSGTVFLDEIGEMPLSLQAKLLRVLEQHEVLRVGALRARPIHARFISATNRDLEAETARGRFRQDLYFRLNGVSLTVPPLRERQGEIRPLARAFVEQASQRAGRSAPAIAPEVWALLESYHWPGNIRELRNMMDRALLFCDGPVITLEHVPSGRLGPHVQVKESSPGEAARATIPPAPAAEERSGTSLEEMLASPDDERDRIVAALDACRGNQTQAAKLLGVSRRTLVSRLTEYDLPRPRKKTE